MNCLNNKTKKFNIYCTLFGISLGGGILFNTQASYADECNEVSSDPSWNESMQMLADMVGDKKFEDAHRLAKQMNARCSRSPMMNFIEGKMSESEGNLEEAKFFYQKASEYTYEFAVSPDVSKRIWYARYEFEHPERTEVGIKRLVDEKLAIENEKLAKEAELTAAQTTIVEHDAFYAQKLEEEYKLAMWTGTGIGIAGVAMLATGLGLIASMSDEDKYEERGNNVDKVKSYKISNRYNAGWAMFGIGIAATVSGAIVSGIFGYKLTHIERETSMAIQLSPTSASFSMTF